MKLVIEFLKNPYSKWQTQNPVESTVYVYCIELNFRGNNLS